MESPTLRLQNTEMLVLFFDNFMYLWAQLTSHSASPREALAAAPNSEQILSVKSNF
jgi:hypothetical protein